MRKAWVELLSGDQLNALCQGGTVEIWPPTAGAIHLKARASDELDRGPRPELREVPLDEARAALGGIVGGLGGEPVEIPDAATMGLLSGEAEWSADVQARVRAQRAPYDGAFAANRVAPKDGAPTPAGVLRMRADELHKQASDMRYQADAAARTAATYREAADLLQRPDASRHSFERPRFTDGG